jgi:hypothetical protein
MHHRVRGSSKRRRHNHKASNPKNTAALSVRTTRPRCTGSGSTAQIAAATKATRVLKARRPTRNSNGSAPTDKAIVHSRPIT